jgi:hypothetical protein
MYILFFTVGFLFLDYKIIYFQEFFSYAEKIEIRLFFFGFFQSKIFLFVDSLLACFLHTFYYVDILLYGQFAIALKPENQVFEKRAGLTESNNLASLDFRCSN